MRMAARIADLAGRVIVMSMVVMRIIVVCVVVMGMIVSGMMMIVGAVIVRGMIVMGVKRRRVSGMGGMRVAGVRMTMGMAGLRG